MKRFSLFSVFQENVEGCEVGRAVYRPGLIWGPLDGGGWRLFEEGEAGGGGGGEGEGGAFNSHTSTAGGECVHG